MLDSVPSTDVFFLTSEEKKVFDSNMNLCREFNFEVKIIYPYTQQHAALRLEAASGISKQETLIKNTYCTVQFSHL